MTLASPLALALTAVLGLGPAGDTAPPDVETPVQEQAELPADEDEVQASETVQVPEPQTLSESGEAGAPVLEPEPSPTTKRTPEPMMEPAPAREGPVDETEADAVIDTEFDPSRDGPEAIRARGWLRSGIVATSVGVVLGVTSIVLGTLDPCAPKGGNSCFVEARNRAALAAGIPGALLITGGVAMLSVGAVRIRRIRASVHVADGGASFGLQGRF